jgi:hypothetical protein
MTCCALLVGGSSAAASPSSQSGHATHTSTHRASTSSFDFSKLDQSQQGKESEDGEEKPWRMLAPFLLLVCLALLLLFRLLNGGTASVSHPAKDFACEEHQIIYEVRPADTCWAIAQDHNMSVDQLKSINAGINCDLLKVGEKICISDGTQ